MKKIISLLVILAVLASIFLIAASAAGDGEPVLTVASLSKQEYNKGDTVEVPSYTVEGIAEYTVNVVLFLPDSEIILLAHEEDGNITHYTNNTDINSTSFCVSDTAFCAEMKGEYTLRYVVYDKEYNRTVTELTFNVN